MNEVIGDATKSRIIALFIDNLIAIGIMLVIVSQIPAQYPILKGIFVFSSYLMYFVLFEGIWSRTPGKYFQGLVIRKLDGGECDWKAAIIRSILRIIEINPILIGGLPAGIAVIATERKQRIGDILAGTLVVPLTKEWRAKDTVAKSETQM